MAVPVEVKVKMDAPLRVCDAVSGVRALYQKAELCDMEFHVDGQVFPVHQAILACGSNNFRTFFKRVVEQSADVNGDDAELKGMLSLVEPAAARPAGEPLAEPSAKAEEPAAPAAEAGAPAASDSTPPQPAAPAAGAEPAPAPSEKPPSDTQAAASTSDAPATPAAPAAPAAPSSDAMDVSAPAPQQDAAAAEAASAAATAPVEAPPASADGPRRVRLNVAGIAHPEAFTIMLNYVYEVGAGMPWRYEPSSKEVNKDVLRLAKTFGLHHLHDHAARWLTRNLTTGNVVERLVTMEDFGLGSLRERVIEQLAWKPEELGMVSTSPEIMQHPRILQDILVKVASQRGKAQKKEAPAQVKEEQPDTAAQEAAAQAAKEAAEKEAAAKEAAAKEAAEKEAAEQAAAEKAAAEKAAAMRAAEARTAAAKEAAAKAAAAAAEAAAAERAAAEEQERVAREAREAEATRRTIPLAERLEASARSAGIEKPAKQEKPSKPSAKGAAKAPPAKRQKRG